jgi:hypothetical protein
VPELMKDVREKLNMLGEVNTCGVMSNWFALAFAGRFLDTYQLDVWNALMQYWIRDEKNKCLKEATKSFRFLGQIVRLIILWSHLKFTVGIVF